MKKKIDVVRAWRDEEYRNSLSPEERAGTGTTSICSASRPSACICSR